MSNDLKEFIKKHGDETVALWANTTLRAVADWRRGNRRPRPKEAIALVKAGNGELTFEAIYSDVPQLKDGPETAEKTLGASQNG